MSTGISNISFFGADGSTQSYLDNDGTLRYERNRSGAEFLFNVTLGASRTIQIRVVAFNHERSLDELEEDAREQLRRILLALGKIGQNLTNEAEAAAAKSV